MKLITAEDKFVWDGGYDSRHLPKQAQFRWDPVTKKWWTSDTLSAYHLYEYADEHAKLKLDDLKKARDYNLNMSKSVDAVATIEPPCPKGLAYKNYQKTGIEYMVRRIQPILDKDNPLVKGVLLADDMGTGKTIQILGLINTLPKLKRILVVCPCSVKVNWQREAQKWLVKKRKISMNLSDFDTSEICIVNYESLNKSFASLFSSDWDLLVCDESHRLKNGKSQACKALFGYWSKEDKKNMPGIQSKVKAIICATGTPFLNRPMELWTTLQALDPVKWNNWSYYATRYAGACRRHVHIKGSREGRIVWQFAKPEEVRIEPMNELQEKLRSSIMIRRLKSEVLKELPPKVRQIIEIEENSSVEETDEVKRFLSKVSSAEELKDIEAYEQAMKALDTDLCVSFQENSTKRREAAEFKLPFAVELINDALENEPDRKIVVFAHHQEIIDTLHEMYKDVSVKYHGGMDKSAAQMSVDKFQSDKGCKLIFISILAGGVGITLTAASHVVFIEYDWRPGMIDQAESRVDRIGQNESMLIQYLVVEDSIDSVMAKRLVDKTNFIRAATDADIEDIQTIEYTEEISADAGKSPAQKKTSLAAECLKEKDTKVILKCLQKLAGSCDGAKALDGHGFNAMDSAIGKDLAGNENLSPRQAALGLKIVYKYRKTQLGQPMAELLEKMSKKIKKFIAKKEKGN